MNLSDKFTKCKDWFQNSEKEIFTVLIIFLTAFISFGLGRLSNLLDKKKPIVIENMPAAISAVLPTTGDSETEFLSGNLTCESGLLVASKNGTKYYFPWCGAVTKIKEENKIWFSSREEAEKNGYSPAKNCKGL